MSKDSIAFIGLGAMGLPMARNLVKGGFAVTGFDLDANALDSLEQAGGKRAASARAAAEGAGLVIAMLPTAAHIRAALEGEGGALAALTDASLFINMSTILPQETDAIAALLAERGLRMLDSPVGRSAMEAERGTLLILASGSGPDKARAQEALLCMGNQIIDCGEVGGGSRVKVVNNFMGISLNALTAEALTLAEACGLSVELALQVMRGTIAGLGHMNITYPNKVLRGDLSAGFQVDLAHKDLGLALELASRSRACVPMGSAAYQSYTAARAQGLGAQDYSAIYPLMRSLAGLPKALPYTVDTPVNADPFGKAAAR
ncbi:2-(hydroxymethyl)glutarate dehydrogenase [Achromobacter denitrificans]|uniref:Sulfolactaldehyde 3-reductase n=1 Tax=Achromobacter denitrificans TaxID=32002 RepID=A0ABZ3G2I8_ACHDE|nr:sulfolactaldehyde 3-reductase [Achromobacter denitrificans]OLU03945.1 gamma-hydroxybutyrate dehydrogenase [Achromobacter denitrificans]QKH44458.1 sulfolactaldehyde 3-reductase [Achromobacter denitrificans]QKH48401.1 sulfolactaldehyde 3-reductase [Achromobacter denitrificans]CAB3737159.1 3-sulfolactaldehyde reductase [Achromobacter denitrificans]SUU06409.1 2-(hydroxymethyl)glutarate dehydrogenase [Achromobacter denitrificans]